MSEYTVITYQGIASDKGGEYTLSYRRVGMTATGKGIWDYRVHEIDPTDKWWPVRNPRVVRNLDAGKHPRE